MAQTGTGTRSIRPVGLGLTLFGSALVYVSITSFNWYAVEKGADRAGSSFDYHDLRHNVDQLDGLRIAHAYFNWLAWVLLAAVAALGLAASIPSRASDWLRFLGFTAGAAGTAGTYYAIDQLFHAVGAAGGSSSVWRNSTVGLWAALGGYLIAAFGASLGPRRDRDHAL